VVNKRYLQREKRSFICIEVVSSTMPTNIINVDVDHEDTLLKIEQNNNTLTGLHIGDGNHTVYRTINRRDIFSRIGNSIGTNTHLKNLVVSIPSELDVTTHREFFDGLTRNNSIENLHLHGRGDVIDVDVLHEILKSFQSNSDNLVELYLNRTLQIQENGGEHILAATLRGCSNLTNVFLRGNDITDEQLLVLADAMKGKHSLEVLRLDRNSIGDAGCESLSTLLTNPQSNLQFLGMNNNNISNDGAITILNALEGNNRLEKLSLVNRDIPMDNVVKDSLSRLLCNTSSINSTYSSNHTVHSFYMKNMKKCLTCLLNMNKDTNKSYVAMRKILKHHPKIDMEPFFAWDVEGELTLKGLPYVLAWFEKARRAVIVNEEGYEDDTDGEKECNVEKRKLLAIYEFAKAMPLRLVPASSIKTGDKKRKKIGK